MMDRRSILLGGLAAALVGQAHAQRVYRVATLVNGTERTWSGRIAALRGALASLGYAEGRNTVFIGRWSGGDLARLPDLAAEIVRERPDVTVCGPTLACAAMQKHSRVLPVVQGSGAGMVKIGLAKSFARPGTNVTGVETQTEELTPKHIELLRTVAPRVSRIAVLNTGQYLFHDDAWAAARQAAGKFRADLVDVRVERPADLTRLSAACAKGGCDALYVLPDPILFNWRADIIRLADELRLPGVYFQPEFVADGGLISYSADIEDMWRRASVYVDKILKGAKPADLPIERPSKFDLAINLRTAASLGLVIPGELLARADRVIR